jgi:heme exporter protein C
MTATLHEAGAGHVTSARATAQTDTDRRARRRRRALSATGLLALIGLATTVCLGLWVTPNAVGYGGLVRLLYIHPPLAWVAFLAFGICSLGSLLYLWPRTSHDRFDRVAGASAEVGVVFIGLTLVTGSIWGRPTWGVWWTWDPLLTTTALLFVLYCGYLALRAMPGDPAVVARRSAIGALVAFCDVPIVYFSVSWWRSLHQPQSINLLTRQSSVHGIFLVTLMTGFVSFTLAFAWLTAHRYRLSLLRDLEATEGLQTALEERRAEGSA